ncbi:MAG TPA: HEAT repeat domain-containing protein [Planctomycetota bacterium]|nr:HEAT repeat domain-containing protein [Planctomycetota bacterium]
MSDILSKLGSFAASKDSRLACAAAVILAELSPRDPVIVKQLAEALNDGDPVRRPFIIEALGRIGTAEAAAALVPLIKSEGPASEQALRAIAHTASAALKPLLKMVGHVPPALLERIAECAGRTGENAAFSGLFGGLLNADTDTCRAIRGGLRTAMSSFDAKSKENLRKQLEQAFKDKALTQHHPSLIALMKIAGDLGDISLQSPLIERIDASYPPHVRRAALQSIAMLHYSGEQRAKLAPKLLPLMADSDLGNLAEPALEALRQAQLTSEHQAALKKLLNSQSSRIREFAMQGLAAQGSTRTLHDLLACLDSPDRSVREEALGALSRAPAAAGLLSERLLELEGGEAALETARALAAQATKIPPRQLESLSDMYVKLASPEASKKSPDADALRKADEKRRAILNVFRSANAPQLVHAVVARASKLRDQDEPQRAYQMLKDVSNLNGWDDKARLEMAFAGLSIGSRDMSRSARSNDPDLRLIEDVLSSGRMSAKDVAKLVSKDTGLSRRTVYYIGFHFTERLAHERQFGQLVLENLAESRSEEGKQAKEKLAIEGLITVRGGKAGILEERAKVLLSASDMIAAEAARAAQAEAERKKAAQKNGKAKAVSKAKSKPARPAVKPKKKAAK